MAHRYRLTPALTRTLDDARAELEEEIREHRDAWDDASERWQEGERGTNVAAWLDGLDAVAEALEGIDAEPEE